MTQSNAVSNALSGATGTGQFVGDTSPTLVTPALGTPSSGNLSNCSGYPGSSATLVTTFSYTGGSQTWTKSTSPATKYIEVYGWAGGGGGGSGRSGASGAAGGGSGGGPAGAFYYTGPASYFGSTETITIGQGGPGGTSVGTGISNGNDGTDGGNTSFGNLYALGGHHGVGGSTGSPAGGATQGIYTLLGSNTVNTSLGGAASPNGSPTVTAVVGIIGPTGGAGGSGADSTTAQQAGNGGDVNNAAGSQIVAGGIGGLATGTPSGSDGNGQLSSGGLITGGTGGGGGGGAVTAVSAGGNGGNGAVPGGGGGGGGGGITAVLISGPGGNGGNGYVIVIEYF